MGGLPRAGCGQVWEGEREIAMKFTDEDGGRISLRDEGNYELAVETALESAKGRAEGKLEIWVVDV